MGHLYHGLWMSVGWPNLRQATAALSWPAKDLAAAASARANQKAWWVNWRDEGNEWKDHGWYRYIDINIYIYDIWYVYIYHMIHVSCSYNIHYIHIYHMIIYERLCKVGLHFAIAKLVQIVPISLWFVVLATIDTGVYKPTTHHWRGPHCGWY